MSYDIWLEADLGGDEPVRIGEWNFTSNCAPMWYAAMPETDGLAGMAGMLAGDAAATLRIGIERMAADPAKYIAMNPENGWGSYDTQLSALLELFKLFTSAPAARVSIWR